MRAVPHGFAAPQGWRGLVLFGFLGAVAGLGQAPTDLWPVTLIAFAILFWLWDDGSTPRQAATMVWAFGAGYFVLTLRWIVEPFLVDIARHGWMAPFALVLMAAGAGIFWAGAGWFAARFGLGRIGLGLGLVTAEVLRALVLTGFPWGLIGHIWIDTPLAQLGSIGGPHLLSLLAVGAALALAALLGPWRLFGLVALGLLVVAAFVIRPAPMTHATGPLVRLIQPNAPQDQKWDPAYSDMFLNRAINLTGEGQLPDLVVWPETAVPYLLNHVVDDLGIISDAARGAPVVFGIQRRDEDFNYYNSLVVLGAGGVLRDIYDKRHLVPFGEYMPGARLLGRIGASGLAANLGVGFARGQNPGPVDLPGVGLAVPLICYEGIFAEEVTWADTRPRLLLLITNDAWFGQGAGPRQHLAQARLRAIEQGLPMVRVANTGISAMIDGYGRVTAHLPLGTAGALDAPLPAGLPPTAYSRFGDWPVIAFLVVAFGAAFLRRTRDSD